MPVRKCLPQVGMSYAVASKLFISSIKPPPVVCRLDRLQYLVSTLRDGGIKWHMALTMPEMDWLDMYSGYKAWRTKQGR